MKTADNAGLCQVIEAIGLPAVLELSLIHI